MNIKIGIQLAQYFGDMRGLRAAWTEAEALGADRIYVCDHFHAQRPTRETVKNRIPSEVSLTGNVFEATTLQAAIAATTSVAEIGCIVHANSYRNPNLMADVARTIDHISGGRFILGMGAGYFKPDYDEYGFEHGTAKSRMLALARDLPVIERRLQRLNPPPLRRIPLMVAALGDNIGLRLVAKHADMWNVIGELDKIAYKKERLEALCREIGRDPSEIEMSVNYTPDLSESGDPDSYLALGLTHIIVISFGPKWDLGLLREVLGWRREIMRGNSQDGVAMR